jgi:hypothetical protein
MWLDAALLARLKGELPPALTSDEARARARAAEGDPAAQALVTALDTEARMAARVGRALARERCQVILADGSHLTLDHAETQLLKKEETRAHPQLRRSVDESLSPFRHFDDHRSGGSSPIPDPGADADTFLTLTQPAMEAARSVLGTVGGEELASPASLARGLDLPSESGGFSEAAAVGLLVAAREAAGPALLRTTRRVRVPRALAGIALVNLPEPRFGTPAHVLRYDRHARSVIGGLQALVAAAGAAADESFGMAHGIARGIGVFGAPVRKSALGEARSAAERHGRIAAACCLLQARLQVALWRAAARTPGDRDGLREAVAAALGGDPGLGEALDRAEDFTVAGARAWRGAAQVFLQERDAHDETFPLQLSCWREPAPAGPSEADAAAWLQLAAEAF